jgi:hypothetical protein
MTDQLTIDVEHWAHWLRREYPDAEILVTADGLIRMRAFVDDGLKPMRDFVQMDGWANMPGDGIMTSDDDDDALTCLRTREPQRSGTTVRILIAADAKRDDVVRIIRKQLAWFERGLDLDDLREPW